MSELSDYRRMVEAPMIKRYEERLRAAHSEIDRLRSSLPEREGWQPKDGVQEAVEAVKLYAKWAL